MRQSALRVGVMLLQLPIKRRACFCPAFNAAMSAIPNKKLIQLS